MKQILRIISGIENISQENRNKLYLNVCFKAYDDTFSDIQKEQKSYRG
jgi:hypothetical protein